ncbi:MAG: ribonuclease P protein component [Saprospiraceae bacterium]
MPDFRFTRAERLKSRKLIGALFKEGQSFAVFPLRIIFIRSAEGSGVQAAFSVSKRHFKRAVQRNRIKRQMREAYRLRKNQFPDTTGQLSLMVLYTAKEALPYAQIEAAMGRLLKKINR